jgi:hypothetical protein
MLVKISAIVSKCEDTTGSSHSPPASHTSILSIHQSLCFWLDKAHADQALYEWGLIFLGSVRRARFSSHTSEAFPRQSRTPSKASWGEDRAPVR